MSLNHFRSIHLRFLTIYKYCMMVMDDGYGWLKSMGEIGVGQRRLPFWHRLGGPKTAKSQTQWNERVDIPLICDPNSSWYKTRLVFDMHLTCYVLVKKIHLPKIGLGLWITTLTGLQFPVGHMWHDLTIWRSLLKCSRWVKKPVFRRGSKRPR